MLVGMAAVAKNWSWLQQALVPCVSPLVATAKGFSFSPSAANMDCLTIICIYFKLIECGEFRP